MIRLYHLSLNPKLTTLIPRIPKNAAIKAKQEDDVSKRVCFGRSVAGALSAVPHGEIGDVMYIYMPTSIDKKYVYYPTPYQVPDVGFTHEVWYTAPVSVKKVGALIIGNSILSKILHHPKDPELTAPAYKRNYKRFGKVPTKEERKEYLKTQSEYQEYVKNYRIGMLKGILGTLGGLAVFALVGSGIKRIL